MADEVNYAGGLNFSDLASKAQTIVDGIEPQAQKAETPAEPVQTHVDVTPAQTDQADEAVGNIQEPSTGKVLELGDDALVRVKIDGEIQEVPYKDFKDSLQREAAWHKRQQDFARGKKELETFYAQQFAELEQGARALKAYESQLQSQLTQLMGQKQTPSVQAQVTQTQDEIATLSEVRQEAERIGKTIDEKIAARDQSFEQKLVNAVKYLQQNQSTQKLKDTFDAGLQQRVMQNSEFSMLKDVIPHFKENLRYQVTQLGPQDINEAIDFAERIARDWSGKVKQLTIAEQQKAQAAKARAKMEPADGSPVAPKNASKPKSFLTKDGKLNHNALREAAMALLD